MIWLFIGLMAKIKNQRRYAMGKKSIANQISPSQVSGRLATWHRVMEEAGLEFDDLQVPINDPEMRKRLVLFWRNGGFKSTTSQERAREIMGNNFFGVEEVGKYFQIFSTRFDPFLHTNISFPEAVLEELKDTHVLIAVYPLSVFELRDKTGCELICDPSHYIKEPFLKNRGEQKWQLINKAGVVKPGQNQEDRPLKLLTEYDEVPTAQVVAYSIIGHYLATSEILFKDVTCVRTSSTDSKGNIVRVGYSAPKGLLIYEDWPDDRYYIWASTRKPSI